MLPSSNAAEIKSAIQEFAVAHTKPEPLPVSSGRGQTSREPDPSSVAFQIAQRTSSAFSLQKVTQKPPDLDSLDVFFGYVLDPFGAPAFDSIDKIPTHFNSFREYFDVFHPLQINETISSIKSALLETARYFECRIHSFGSILRIETASFPFEVYDLLYFSQRKTQFVHSDSKALSDEIEKTSFVGVVTNIDVCHSSVNSHHGDIVDVKVSAELLIQRLCNMPAAGCQPSNNSGHAYGSPPLSINDVLYYKYCGNTISNLREYTALRTIRSSSLLKYILRPSFMRDFQEGAIFWDDRRLCFAKSPSSIEYYSALDQNENQVTLQKLLMAAHGLNLSQADAVSKCFFSRERFFLIQGPPGTGKTTTILSIISTFLLVPRSRASRSTVMDAEKLGGQGSSLKILVCAPSNTAIDVIVVRLARGVKNFHGGVTEIPFLRVGASANPDVGRYTLEYLVNSCAAHSRSRLRHTLVSTASVICTTLSSSVSDSMCLDKFDLLIIDEACQATEISTIIPFKYNPDKVIMVGDPNQLPPTVISNQSQLQVSLFERLLSCHQPVMLDVQYRMHPDICRLSSTLFYDGRIKTSADIARLRGKSRSGSVYGFRPLSFVDILEKKEKTDDFKSYYSPVECSVCYRICKELFRRYDGALRIVVLTPYKGQANMLRENRNYEKMGIEVNTVDGFQGKECDVVILSTVRRSGLGFTCDFRRINVAMTRSRECLIVLGSRKCLSQSRVWDSIISSIIQQSQHFTSKNLERFLSTL